MAGMTGAAWKTIGAVENIYKVAILDHETLEPREVELLIYAIAATSDDADVCADITAQAITQGTLRPG